MQELSALALLAVAVLAVAVALAAVVLLLRWLVLRPFRRADAKLPLRRCDRCGRGWRAQPGREATVIGLRLRRRVRRRARERNPDAVPRWAGPLGWSRCPSCLSTRVRTSGEAPTPEPWSGLEKAGALAGLLGVGALVAAVLGALW